MLRSAGGKLLASLLLCTAPLAGCSSEPDSRAPVVEAPPAEQLANLRANVQETAARPELQADRVEVVHVLIGFKGAERSRAQRSMEDAEALAARVYDLARQGESMLSLKREFSEDTGGGVYGMLQTSSKLSGQPLERQRNDFDRDGMAAAFGDVGWRLEVGEIGVAPYHPERSPFGWHIIQRRE